VNVRFLNPFIEAASEVLWAETALKPVRGPLSLDKGAYITEQVTVVLSLIGQIDGVVFYSLSEAVALHLAGRMLGEPFSTFDSLAQSGIAELGNVITGRASIKLAEAGYVADISPPTLLAGQGATLSTLQMARLVVPLQLEPGRLTIHLALREGSQRGLGTGTLPAPARKATAN
jgi:chemotaxis protein CheX